MKKTLGGDRLGSGAKMEVNLHGFNRSTHDLGYIFRTTMAAGTLVPFVNEIMLPGDTFDINVDVDVKTHPTIGPLFGSFKVQGDFFLCPIRLYQAQLHNNKLGIGMNMQNVKLPVIRLRATPFPENVQDYDNAQINPSCILAYLGIRGVGVVPAAEESYTRTFNALSFLAYWDAYKNYYANKQEEIGAVIHTPLGVNQTVDAITIDATPIPQTPGAGSVPVTNGVEVDIAYTGASPDPNKILIYTDRGSYTFSELMTSINDDGAGNITSFFNYALWGDITFIAWDYASNNQPGKQPPTVTTFPLSNLDSMRQKILAAVEDTDPFEVNETGLTPYIWPLEWEDGYSPMVNTQEGLAIKTYQSDLFNNWLNTTWIDGVDGINARTAVSTTGNKFTIDALQLAKKVYDLLNRVAVSGGTYDDYIDAVWQNKRFTRAETPMYMGGLSKELVFQEVISTAQAVSAADAQPLGTLAGKGIMAKKHKGGQIYIKADEPSVLLGIISLTPRIDYSQGNKWHTHLQTMDDFHKPNLDGIGFQDLITEQMAWWTTAKTLGQPIWVQKSAGKQPAWINYMTNVNTVLGNFAIQSEEMFMTLNRRYEYETEDIKDLTTYIDPAKFNNIFAQTSLDAQNFWVQIGVDITARRIMSAKVMPNL